MYEKLYIDDYGHLKGKDSNGNFGYCEGVHFHIYDEKQDKILN